MEGAESPLLTKGQRRRHAAEIFVYLVRKARQTFPIVRWIRWFVRHFDLEILRTIVTFRIYKTNHQSSYLMKFYSVK